MSAGALLYVLIAYGILWLIPVVLLISILVRMHHVRREIATLRQRLDGAPNAPHVVQRADDAET
ncbi:MAG TPA: hypothetical protein GX714_08135 [Chloroflexi bacterium]|jgi:hypothetical protein|nr:hypothetical protein [Chloroflexota bacterium]